MARIIKNRQTGEYCHFSKKSDSFAIRAVRQGGVEVIRRAKNDPSACQNIWTEYEDYDSSPFVAVENNPDYFVEYLNQLNGIKTQSAGKSIQISSNISRNTNNFFSNTGYSIDSDDFWNSASKLIEQTIDELAEEFIKKPYLHRCEHSLHAQFFLLAKKRPELARECQIGTTKQTTQLIHKEWPETEPRPEKDNRRGNFDIAVLSPKLLASCSGTDSFNKGDIPAQIVIEFGLNYGFSHLFDDKKKLFNSKPKYGYLVHFARNNKREQNVEELILSNNVSFIKTAYVCVCNNTVYYKKINDTEIKTVNKM